MANVTPTVLILSRDPDVKLVASTLQAEGITSRTAASNRDLQRALAGSKGRCVAVLDGELVSDPAFPAADVLEKLRNMPLLVLLPVDGGAGHQPDPQRSSWRRAYHCPPRTSHLSRRQAPSICPTSRAAN